MRRALAIAAPLLALALAACGDALLDTDEGEKFVRSTVAEQTGARVSAVACPDDVKIKRGGTFRCLVTGTDKTKGEAVVRQTDDKGNVHVDAAFLHVREAEAVMGNEFTRRLHVEVTVVCPEIVVVKSGGRFACKATAGHDTRPVQVNMTDAKGHFDYHLG